MPNKLFLPQALKNPVSAVLSDILTQLNERCSVFMLSNTEARQAQAWSALMEAEPGSMQEKGWSMKSLLKNTLTA